MHITDEERQSCCYYNGKKIIQGQFVLFFATYFKMALVKLSRVVSGLILKCKNASPKKQLQSVHLA